MQQMPPYLTGIEGPPPKRNVVRSSRAGGATSEQKSALLRRLFMLWAKTSPARSLAPPFQLLSAPMRLQAGRPPCERHFSPLRSIDFNRPIQNDRCKPSNNGLQRFCYHFWAVSELSRNDFTYFPYGASAGNAAGVSASSGYLRSCPTKASRSSAAGADSLSTQAQPPPVAMSSSSMWALL